MQRIEARIINKSDTTYNWNNAITFIPLKGEIIIYTDRSEKDDGNGNKIKTPGIKIGDGNAYLIDLPFVGEDMAERILEQLNDHVNNQMVHVTSEDRAFWNAKLNCDIEEETMILNRE